MKNDKGWRLNDEGWWFLAVEGFWFMTDERTDEQTFVNVESLSRLKMFTRCRNIAIMATDPNKALSGGEEVVVKKARVTSLKFKDASIQHGHGRRETRKVSRQRSVTGSARRLMNSPPPKQTPPLNPDEFSGSVSRRSSSSQSPRPPSSASSRPLYPSPPPRRVSTPLYVIGSPPSNDQDQENNQTSFNLTKIYFKVYLQTDHLYKLNVNFSSKQKAKILMCENCHSRYRWHQHQYLVWQELSSSRWQHSQVLSSIGRVYWTYSHKLLVFDCFWSYRSKDILVKDVNGCDSLVNNSFWVLMNSVSMISPENFSIFIRLSSLPLRGEQFPWNEIVIGFNYYISE